MTRRRFGRHTLLIGAIAAVLTTFTAIPAAAHQTPAGHHNSTPRTTVIATGLNNPRQLSFDQHGNLYVAEAGTGGSGPCITSPEGDTTCFGATGSITKISARGKQSRVVTGLPSLANQGDGSQASGPSDVVPLAQGKLAILLGFGADAPTRASLPAAAATMGTLQINHLRSGHSWTVADFVAFEQRSNPVDDINSNPVGLTTQGKHRFVVADAGGNDVLSTRHDGRIRTVAPFFDRMVAAPAEVGLPPGAQIPMQAVPTSVVRGPDGALYVSQLTGFPFPKGAANIYRISSSGHVSIYASGLTTVTDLAFRGRTLYAVEITSQGLLSGSNGALVRVDKHSTSPKVVVDDLFTPYGLAIRGNNAYVTTGSIAAGGGQVLRVSLRGR